MEGSDSSCRCEYYKRLFLEDCLQIRLSVLQYAHLSGYIYILLY